MTAQADTNCHDIGKIVSATWTHLAKIGATYHVVPTCHDMSATFPPKKATGKGILKIISFTDNPPPTEPPLTFRQVLSEWNHTWMWESLNLSGDGEDEDSAWLREAIKENTLVAVTDGSYMKELYLDMNSCAFILECSQGRGRMSGAFSEQTRAACSYRGELLGLLAIHLILLSINKINPTLTGSVHIYSDCMGALNKVKNLPPHRIPS